MLFQFFFVIYSILSFTVTSTGFSDHPYVDYSNRIEKLLHMPAGELEEAQKELVEEIRSLVRLLVENAPAIEPAAARPNRQNAFRAITIAAIEGELVSLLNMKAGERIDDDTADRIQVAGMNRLRVVLALLRDVEGFVNVAERMKLLWVFSGFAVLIEPDRFGEAVDHSVSDLPTDVRSIPLAVLDSIGLYDDKNSQRYAPVDEVLLKAFSKASESIQSRIREGNLSPHSVGPDPFAH